MSDEQRIRGSGTVEKPSKGAGRGGPKRGYSWPPFQPGHTLSVRHGAYSIAVLTGRSNEIAAGIRQVMDTTYEPKFEAAVAGAALVMARIERAHEALDAATDPNELRRLDADCRSWMRQLLSWLEALGLTPRSAASLGLLRRAADPLREYLDAEYAEASDG